MAETEPQDRVRQLVRQRIADLRLSLAEVSLKLGRNHAYLQQFLERGTPREIPEKIRPALAAILGVDERALRRVDGADGRTGPQRHDGAARRIDPVALAGSTAKDRDLPVYASAQGGPTGMLVTPDPIDWVPRPRPLEHVAQAFAVYVVGDSMEPAYRHGDMVLVHPSLPPLRGDDVLLVKHQPDRDMIAMVKNLVGWNDRSWRLKQWNPAREFQASRQEWQQAHVIVGKYNRR
ncbi:MAG TPA: S24 family peptidase [Alphaproteobacteria bacterium]